jgi:hypothetical protein
MPAGGRGDLGAVAVTLTIVAAAVVAPTKIEAV